MDSTSFGNNWFVTTARALTTNAYQVQAINQANAQSGAAANASSIAGILNKPFFGVSGGVSGIWTKYKSLILGALAIWAAVKYVLPMFGIRILWGKRRGASSGRRNILARARAAKRRKRGL